MPMMMGIESYRERASESTYGSMKSGSRSKRESNIYVTHSLTQRGLVIMTLNCRGLAEGSAATEQQRETYLPDTPSSSHKALSVPGLLITSCKILCVCVCI